MPLPWLTGPQGLGAGRAGWGGWTRAPGPAAPPFPPGSASVLLSLLSLVHLSRALPRKVILTKDSHRTRVSLRFGQGQNGPQLHAGCLCPRATRNIRERERARAFRERTWGVEVEPTCRVVWLGGSWRGCDSERTCGAGQGWGARRR